MKNKNTFVFDTRSITNGDNVTFVAIRTDSADGHNFIAEAYGLGVRAFIVDYQAGENILEKYPDADFTFVKDTLEYIKELASEKRKSYKGTVIAVCGSRGKTVSKELLAKFLGKKCCRSPRSYNSQLGVPVSMLNHLDIDDESRSYFIIEAGISQKNEMLKLEEVISPDIVLLTNVTNEHDEGFDGRLDKINEKLALASRAKCLVYPADDPQIHEAVKEFQKKINPSLKLFGWTFGKEKVRVVLSSETDGDKDKFAVYNDGKKEVTFTTQPLNKYEKENLSGCVATLMAIGVLKTVKGHLEIPCISTRLTVLEAIDNCKIIVDSFTRDVLSLQPTLDFLRRTARPGSSLTVLLNRIPVPAEPSPYSDLSEIIPRLLDYGIGKLIILGQTNPHDLKRIDRLNVTTFETIKDLIDHLPELNFNNETILINKPAQQEALEPLLGKLEARQHETYLEISLDALKHNYNFFKSRLKPETGIICMLKAGGYGAGSVEIARSLENQGVDYVAVAVTDEGTELRSKSVNCPVIVLNPRAHNLHQMFQSRLQPAVYGFDILKDIVKTAIERNIKQYPVHIKLETGMRRLGFLKTELPDVAEIINRAGSHLKVETAFSHLATADCLDADEYTLQQINEFEECVKKLENKLGYKVKKHILNSAGILRFPQYQADLVRLGLGLYGISPIPPRFTDDLMPVASMFTTIISLKQWRKGDTVGYSRRGVLTRDAVIATLPVGYADGIDRRLGNGNASMWVGGTECPTVGNICMDICMIDVTEVKNPRIGDKVEIFGPNNPVNRLAQKLGTIPYEILTSVSSRVKRIYFQD